MNHLDFLKPVLSCKLAFRFSGCSCMLSVLIWREKNEQVVIVFRMQQQFSEQGCKLQVFIGILSVHNLCLLSKVLPIFWYCSMDACMYYVQYECLCVALQWLSGRKMLWFPLYSWDFDVQMFRCPAEIHERKPGVKRRVKAWSLETDDSPLFLFLSLPFPAPSIQLIL